MPLFLLPFVHYLFSYVHFSLLAQKQHLKMMIVEKKKQNFFFFFRSKNLIIFFFLLGSLLLLLVLNENILHCLSTIDFLTKTNIPFCSLFHLTTLCSGLLFLFFFLCYFVFFRTSVCVRKCVIVYIKCDHVSVKIILKREFLFNSINGLKQRVKYFLLYLVFLNTMCLFCCLFQHTSCSSVLVEVYIF